MEAEQMVMPGAMELIESAEEKKYNEFVEKFKPKLTTDDCYTPGPVYDAVAAWVAKEYERDPAGFVRPFWPGADYTVAEYPEGCTVVDNPPFSIFTKILRYYQERRIPFFLFGPSLTLYNGDTPGVCYISADAQITYANGANVLTGFATNLDRYTLRSAPELHRAVKAANDAVQKTLVKTVPKYTYPDYVCTSAMVQRYSRYGIDFRVSPEECSFIRALDAQRGEGKAIFGGGFLLSERAAAERAAAERAAAERAAAERAAATKWALSDREWRIVRGMSGGRATTGETWTNGQISMTEMLKEHKSSQ